MATRWQKGVCRQWRQAGSSPVEENTAAMACWAQRRLESQCTVSTSSSSQDPSDIALPGLQPLPVTHLVSAHTHIPCIQWANTHTNMHHSNTQSSTIAFYVGPRMDWKVKSFDESANCIFLQGSALSHVCGQQKWIVGSTAPHGWHKNSVSQHHQPLLRLFLSSPVVHGI